MTEAQVTRSASCSTRQPRPTTSSTGSVDGADDDWASWYGDWLVRLSELPRVLGVVPVRSEPVYLLVRLDKEYVEQRPAEMIG